MADRSMAPDSSVASCPTYKRRRRFWSTYVGGGSNPTPGKKFFVGFIYTVRRECQCVKHVTKEMEKVNYLQQILENTTHFFQYFFDYTLFCLTFHESMTGFRVMNKICQKIIWFPPRIDLRFLLVLSVRDDHYTTETDTMFRKAVKNHKFVGRQAVFSEKKNPIFFQHQMVE